MYTVCMYVYSICWDCPELYCCDLFVCCTSCVTIILALVYSIGTSCLLWITLWCQSLVAYEVPLYVSYVICVHTHTHARTQTHTHTYIHTHTHTYTHTHIPWTKRFPGTCSSMYIPLQSIRTWSNETSLHNSMTYHMSAILCASSVTWKWIGGKCFSSGRSLSLNIISTMHITWLIPSCMPQALTNDIL